MHILHIATELACIAKTGGLGDVTYGLCKQLQRLGHQVHILLPKYDTLQYNKIQNLRVHCRDLWSYDGPDRYHNTIWAAEADSLPLFLVEPHHPAYIFNRGTIYGCVDDVHRFLYFSRTCMEFLFKSGFRPDIIHLHDWPVAIIPVLQKDMYKSLGFAPIKTVLTLHNLEYQGKCFAHELSQTGLHGESYLHSGAFQDPKDPHLVNIVKAGILYADKITTVSPSYRQEIFTKEGGFGLDATLRSEADKIQGILNGIDEDFWNPLTDPHVPFPFSPTSGKLAQDVKASNKLFLQKQLKLEESTAPLIICIGRLVDQKGPHLIAEAFKHIVAQGAQCVILGSTFNSDLHDLFRNLQVEYANSLQGKIILDYDEVLSHILYAASDMLLMPSIFEPCGLSQMIAMRYGSVPIVRKTGGLIDTISTKNGFIFENPNAEELCTTIDVALQVYKEQPQKWLSYMQQGMEQDYSWLSAAKEYVSAYTNTLKVVAES